MWSVDDQLLTIDAVYAFCKEEIKIVEFFLISSEVLQISREFLQLRYVAACTVPGTRSFHHFASDATSKFKFKWVSDDHSFCGEHNFLTASTACLKYSDVPLMTYVCCIYDFQWWIGLVIESDTGENDLHINFLHPSGPSDVFYWPSREDKCWVLISHILCKINLPRMSSAGTSLHNATLKYTILGAKQKRIKRCFDFFKT